MKVSDLQNLPNSGRIVILDGAMGTELERRGVRARLPLWSSWALLEAPQVVRAIHREYIEAGADIITANTFRTHRRSLAQEGMGDRAKELTRLAVDLAAGAREEAGVEILIAGSLAPLEDCYHPERVSSRDRLAAEHGEMAENLARAGVDLLLVETMGTIEEIDAASRAAEGTGTPYLVSVIPREDGTLLGGQSLAEMARLLESRGPLAVMVNCANYRVITKAIGKLLTAQLPFPVGAYANMGGPEYEKGWSFTDELSPSRYAEVARTWVDMGVRVVGGCCGTTPAHITELASALK
ncbi:MAG TPA: homocysteine S-methyltransferase family protein [Vicinamibacteria bacterium]|nr:homocysteine S-methyltransferase family protein [Vicinamibacteria bacterium]